MSGKLTNKLFKPGTKFIVADSTKTKAIPPGSIGFISNYGGQFRSLPNITTAEVAIIRRGRKGKDRVERATFVTPVFDIGPEIDTAKYRGYHFVYIKPIENIYKSVLDMPVMDLFGWGLAYCHHLLKLFKQMNNRWPKEKYNPVNTMRNIPHRFGTDPIHTVDNFYNPDFIEALVLEMRRLESLSLRLGARQKMGVTVAKLKALLYLAWVNIGNGFEKVEETYPQKEILTTIGYHLKILRADQKREFELDQKRFEAYSKGRKKLDRIPKPIKPQLARKGADMIELMKYMMKKSGKVPNFQNILFEHKKKNGGIILNEDIF